jgi:hypothetical protein
MTMIYKRVELETWQESQEGNLYRVYIGKSQYNPKKIHKDNCENLSSTIANCMPHSKRWNMESLSFLNPSFYLLGVSIFIG